KAGQQCEALDFATKAVGGTPINYRTVAEQGLKLLDESAQKENFSSVSALPAILESAARKAGSNRLMTAVQSKSGKFRGVWEIAEKAKDAAGVLAKYSSDKKAHVAVGKYLCITQERMGQGTGSLYPGRSRGFGKGCSHGTCQSSGQRPEGRVG